MSTTVRTAGTDAEPRQRRADLDRLRVLACLALFVYHGLQMFDLSPYYHIKANTLSPAIDAAARLILAMHMPLFFLISGMAGAMLASGRSDADVLRRRAIRLLPPFLVGVLLLTPWLKYLEVLDGRNISWRGLLPLDGTVITPQVNLWRYFTRMNWFSWSHMWFLLYLLLFSVLLLPLQRWMERTTWQPKGAEILLIGAPLVLFAAVEIVLRPHFPWHIPNLIWDWASMPVYVTCFLSGAALIHWPTLERALQRGVIAWLLLAVCGAALFLSGADAPVQGIGRALWLWSTLCLAISLGPWLARGHVPGERYLSEAALPIYVLHHLPLVAIGTLVKDVPWPIWQRFGVIVPGALIATLVVYHLMVRPFDRLRFAFGMLPRSRTPAQ